MGSLIDLFVTVMGTESDGERIKTFQLKLYLSFKVFFLKFTDSSIKNVTFL